MSSYGIIAIYAIIATLMSLGLIYIIFDIYQLPSIKEKRLLRKLKKKNNLGFENKCVLPIANKITPYIKLSQYNRENLALNLELANMAYTPEIYIARNIVVTAFVVILGIISFIFSIYIFTITCFLFAFIIYYKLKGEVTDRLKAKREAIDKEVPQFIQTVVLSLKNDRDLLGILDKYRLVAGNELRSELDILVTNMKTGNSGDALILFNKRIGLESFSSFITGLISHIKGTDQTVFLTMVYESVNQKHIEKLYRSIERKPDKLRIIQVLLVLCIILIFLTALGLQGWNSMNAVFS
jgi:flagellar protein FlaJ